MTVLNGYFFSFLGSAVAALMWAYFNKKIHLLEKALSYDCERINTLEEMMKALLDPNTQGGETIDVNHTPPHWNETESRVTQR